jgi:hypothetical protein
MLIAVETMGQGTLAGTTTKSHQGKIEQKDGILFFPPSKSNAHISWN